MTALHPATSASAAMSVPEGLPLSGLATPCLVLDLPRFEVNVKRMRERAAKLGVILRPHLKTSKSAAVARAMGGDMPICVSTPGEADYFFDAGYRDICCPNVISEASVDRYAALARRSAAITLCVADLAAVETISRCAVLHGASLQLLIEIESGAGRTGVEPHSDLLLEIARRIDAADGVSLAGVMTYGGHGYAARDPSHLVAIAEEERAAVVRAADRLRAAGLACETVSVGSTPTVLHAAHLDGVTEIRPGNYVFFDGMQVALGAATVDDVALTVLTTVLFSDYASGRIVLDAGALALSKDGANGHYGMLLDLDGQPLPGDVHIGSLNQEHGIVNGVPAEVIEQLPVGAMLRILPHHACLTAAAHDAFHVVDNAGHLIDRWTKLTGTYHQLNGDKDADRR